MMPSFVRNMARVLTSIDRYITFLKRVWDESPSVSS